MSVPNVVWYWGMLAMLLGAAWLFHPLTVTSSYLVSCLILEVWQLYKSCAVWQPIAKNRQANEWRESLSLSLFNTLMLDTLFYYTVRKGGWLTGYHWPDVLEMVHLFFVPAVLIAVHDAWFYFTHRALHKSPILFSYIHSLHHKRSAPRPVDLFYMHPLECLVCVGLPFVAIPAVVPLHWVCWEGFVVKGIHIDVYGHCGFDAAPLHPFKLTQYSLIPRLPWKVIKFFRVFLLEIIVSVNFS